MDTNKEHVFIYFCNAGKALAECIQNKLAVSKITSLMVNTELLDGMGEDKLKEKTSESHAIVIILDEKSQDNENLETVLKEAVLKGKMMFPVKLENFIFNNVLGPYFGNVQWTDYFGEEKDGNLNGMLKKIKRTVIQIIAPETLIVELIGELIDDCINSAKKKASDFKSKIKEKLFAKRKGNAIPLISMLTSVIATALYIYWGVSQNRYPPAGFVPTVTLVPLAVEIALSLLINIFTKKITNKLLTVIVSLLLFALMFVAVLLMGFGLVFLFRR